MKSKAALCAAEVHATGEGALSVAIRSRNFSKFTEFFLGNAKNSRKLPQFLKSSLRMLSVGALRRHTEQKFPKVYRNFRIFNICENHSPRFALEFFKIMKISGNFGKNFLDDAKKF